MIRTLFGRARFIQSGIPRLDLEQTAVPHGVARIDGKVEEGGLQQGGVDMARP
jgi:hypothetical protein